MAKKGGIVSGKYWSLTIVGEIPVGVAPEQWAAVVGNGVSMSSALMPTVQNIEFASSDKPIQPSGGNGGSTPTIVQ